MRTSGVIHLDLAETIWFRGDEMDTQWGDGGKAYLEPARELPVSDRASVVVAGGSPTGVAAAVAAALALEHRTAGLDGVLVKELQTRLRAQNAVLS